ncbi:hypothetical protein Q5P01_019298 [Channa striata]|uniref:G-protein coupled receptors family 1 profile domain-containing protein n=1 Tax=Channa striata TaxID=64152 RepID=A0AA88M101_CHASR|nr:hypothetical protein Q5P01_019298 [Channa striata]
MSFLKNVLNDSGIIHPPGFYIVAFQTLPFINVYFIFLAFVYAVTVMFNILVIFTITSNRCLHTPRFLAVVNLAVIDIILNTSTIPGMIKIFLFKDNFVPFNLCFVQMFFYYAFMTLESFALAILAYDRLIAICFPLRQNSINTLRSMSCIIGLCWCVALSIIGFAIGLMNPLSYCNSLNVFSYFCDYSSVLRIACNDYSLQWSVGSVISCSILGGPLAFIFLSYIIILVTVFRMKSLGSRVKALATCVEHLIIVTIFYIPLIVIFTFEQFVRQIDPEQSLLSVSLASCIPPSVNPVVYSLKTKEVRNRVLALVRKNKINIDRYKKACVRVWAITVCLERESANHC